MTSRARIAAVQIAAFVGGGLLGPVIHLAGHRPDHTHGPGGQTIAVASVPGEPEGDHPHPHPHARPGPEAEPLESGHGHGSIAHLALALLSSAPPLTLPAPEAAGVLPSRPLLRVAALFHPSFPLPRPPPGPVLS